MLFESQADGGGMALDLGQKDEAMGLGVYG
jgi:hypothetical protein